MLDSSLFSFTPLPSTLLWLFFSPSPEVRAALFCASNCLYSPQVDRIPMLIVEEPKAQITPSDFLRLPGHHSKAKNTTQEILTPSPLEKNLDPLLHTIFMVNGNVMQYLSQSFLIFKTEIIISKNFAGEWLNMRLYKCTNRCSIKSNYFVSLVSVVLAILYYIFFVDWYYMFLSSPWLPTRFLVCLF